MTLVQFQASDLIWIPYMCEGYDNDGKIAAYQLLRKEFAKHGLKKTKHFPWRNNTVHIQSLISTFNHEDVEQHDNVKIA